MKKKTEALFLSSEEYFEFLANFKMFKHSSNSREIRTDVVQNPGWETVVQMDSRKLVRQWGDD
jgi:hypothetical protein